MIEKNKKAGTLLFIHSMHDETILLKTDSNLFADIIKSIIIRYNDIQEQMEESKFSFNFFGSLVLIVIT